MTKRKIYARELFRKFDFYHLAKEFYYYIFRYPELESEPEWKEIKEFAEDIIVTHRCSKDVKRILRTFKIKKNVEVTDNGKDNF